MLARDSCQVSCSTTTCPPYQVYHMPFPLIVNLINKPHKWLCTKFLDSNFNFSNLSCMLGHILPPNFSLSISFIDNLLISLTQIHYSIDKIGLSLAFTIAKLKLSLKLFTRQSVKALGEKWDLVHCAGSISTRYFQASPSKLLRCSIPLSNS